jgi:Flp pilus assembly protein TadD
MFKMKIKKATIGLLVVCLIGLLGLGGYRGCRSYQKLQQQLLVKQARDFLAASDLKKALLCLKGALRYNGKDLDACRLMAEVAEKSDPSAGVAWRKRVLEDNPGSLEDRLALAKTAMMAHDFATATNALDKVDQAGRKTAAYHNEAGAAAVALGQFSQAEAHFQEASRLEPTDMVPLLNIAVLRLSRTNESELKEGRAFLRGLSTNTDNASLRRKALLELTADARRYRQTNSALALTKALAQETNAAFVDKLLRLQVLADSGNSELKQTLASVQREAAGDPAKIYELSSWQTKRTPPADLLAWLQSLPAQTQTNRVVALLTAEAYCNAEDWLGLQAFLKPQKWADWECVRYAFQARALDGQQLTNSAKTKWAEAFKESGDRKQSLAMLLELAVKWHWSSEEEKILRDIINKYPSEQWALKELTQILFASGSTGPLLEVFGQASDRNPSDLSLKNNLAWMALLVNAQGWKPNDLAREVYQKSPTNSHFASTYAFSLHLLHKDAEALKVLEKLNPADLENPSIAGGYGLVLQATGDRAKAKKYLEIGSKAPMLPEQRKLIEDASAGP